VKPTRALTLLLAATLFVSAALLFWVEPMVAKMLLPLLGGTPAVWNTCLLFFQTTLLAGYAYALFATKQLTLRAQIFAQLALFVLAVASVPIALSTATVNSVPTEGNPAFWLLGHLALTVGLPFFVLAATSPLLQHWFAATQHAHARDPYFLYAASNVGSLSALLAYPALLEPHFDLHQQSWLWAYGYAFLIILITICGLTLARLHRTQTTNTLDTQRALDDDQSTRSEEPIIINRDQITTNNEQRTTNNEQRTTDDKQLSFRRRLRWLALAFVPSSLMLGVTTFISTDIASLPLLWVIPLALYLLTLVLAFARRQLFSTRLLAYVLPGVTLVLVLVYLSGATQPAAFLMLLHLIYLFVAALTCHTLLAADRPTTAHLPEFYLWLSLGGALGGFFNALLAPALFNTVVEYPLAIILASMLLPSISRRHKPRAQDDALNTGDATQQRRLNPLWLDLALPFALLLAALALAWAVNRYELEYVQALALAAGVPLLVAYQFRRRPFRFALALAAVMLASTLYAQFNARPLHAERNFFGVLRVARNERDTLHLLYNGSTLHGRQFTDFTQQCEPLSYYHREGPLGQVFAAYQAHPAATDIAIVGLGTGATAAYSRANERWTFYEINPAVVSVARAPEYFTYLINCAHAPVTITLGDARLQLAHAPDHVYGLIVLDAFSSDAIPVHLMTAQALDLYLSKLASGGLLVFHISNRSLDLHPVIADLAASRALACVARDDLQPNQPEGKESSQWVVMARRAEDLGELTHDPRWYTLNGDTSRHVWTDDFSNILTIFKWR
jgi:hypothetical protein